MKLIDAISTYIGHLAAAGKSPITVSAYRGDLRQFVEMYAGGNDEALSSVAAVTVEDIETFMDSLTAATPATRARKLSVLSSFFDFLYARRLVPDNPAAEVQRPTVAPIATMSVPDPAVIRRVVESAAHGTRNRAILELLALGISSLDVAALDVGAYDAEAGTMAVRKGDGFRVVALPVTAICALDAYLKDTRPAMRHQRGWERVLFINGEGRRSSRFSIWKVWGAACPAGVNIAPRDLKRARTVALLVQGVSREAVADQMGHAHLTTTQQYEHLAKRVKGRVA